MIYAYIYIYMIYKVTITMAWSPPRPAWQAGRVPWICLRDWRTMGPLKLGKNTILQE